MTARDALLDIQTAIYTRANSDATLDALVTGVFDYVPEGTAKPYVELGEAFEIPDNAHDRFGRETVITLHVWSEHRGYSQALAIADRLIQLFDHQTLTVNDHDVISVRFDFMQTLRDPDPEIRHVPVRFRVVTEQTA